MISIQNKWKGDDCGSIQMFSRSCMHKMSSFLHTDLNFQMFVLQTKPSTVEILEGIDKVCIFLS